MASMEGPSFPLRLFVDKERNRVVVAEANGDFVDTLFSFLTLPLGTIIRLASKDQPHQEPAEIGCINNLYQSVKNCDTQVFWNEICKKMLLCPRNPCEALCKKLRLNVDDTEATKCWMCGFCGRHSNLLLSTFAGVSCSCGKVMDKEMKLQEEDFSKEEAPRDGVFVKRDTIYLIFDDLKVLHNSAANSVKHLVQLGYTDVNSLTEMSPNVGSKEILDLLKRALISKSPLSDVFLDVEDGGSKPMSFFTPKSESTKASGNNCSISLKITVSKSKNKILYAESEADFFDFLFSFLTVPLGSVLNLLDDNVSLGSVDSLYKSVKCLSSSWFTGFSSFNGNPFLHLHVAPQYGCKRQPLKLREEETPTYWHGTGVIRNNICYTKNNGVISKNNYLVQPRAMNLFDPRSPDGRREAAVGFVRRPSVFVVTDDLRVTPLTTCSSISFLQKFNVPLDDLEEHDVRIGGNEALNLLGASLTSKAALTNGLLHLLEKPKEQYRFGVSDSDHGLKQMEYFLMGKPIEFELSGS